MLSTSPAVNAIPFSASTGVNGSPVTTDQRGILRPQGPACDIGAFELAQTGVPSAISSNFNGTAIAGGNYIWFNSALKVKGLSLTKPVNVFVTNSTITFNVNSTPYKLSVPDAVISFSPTATSATTTFDTPNNRWAITVPSSGLAGNTFLDGLTFLVPSGGLPGGIQPVTWSANFNTDTSGITVDWQWAAAVYTSFSGNYGVLGVKPVDDNKASLYLNSDHAGTPENYKQYVTGGARGGGGSNYTGGYSGTSAVVPASQ